MTDLIVRVAGYYDQAEVEALSETVPETGHDFVYLWRRFKNWETQPPFVALEGTQIVGFHAAVFDSPQGYVNTMYHAVLPERRHHGIARMLVSRVLQEAADRKLERMKLKTHADSLGLAFWRGMGLLPFGWTEKPHQYVFDFSIQGCRTPESLLSANPNSADWRTIPPSHRQRYDRYGVRFMKVQQGEGV